MNEKRKIVFDTLDNLKIKYEVIEHKPINTIEELDALNIDPNKEVVKNLFLCDDKKRRFFLISMSKEKTVNLKELRVMLDSRPLSFVSEDRLKSMLKLQKGEVTPFGILNDAEKKVEVIFDEDIESFNRVGVHPNDNTAMVWISPNDLKDVIEKHGNSFSYMDLIF